MVWCSPDCPLFAVVLESPAGVALALFCAAFVVPAVYSLVLYQATAAAW